MAKKLSVVSWMLLASELRKSEPLVFADLSQFFEFWLRRNFNPSNFLDLVEFLFDPSPPPTILSSLTPTALGVGTSDDPVVFSIRVSGAATLLVDLGRKLDLFTTPTVNLIVLDCNRCRVKFSDDSVVELPELRGEWSNYLAETLLISVQARS